MPIHKEGYPFIAIAAVAALIIGLYVWEPLGWTLAVVALWICYFFRDPERVTPARDGLVVAPADGRVSMITTAVPPPETRVAGGADGPRLDLYERVRLPREPRPVTGRIAQNRLHAGPLPQRRTRQGQRGQRAQGPRDRDRRRARSASCKSPDWWRGASSASSREGDTIGAGERFGLIRFGSRVDVYLPVARRNAGRRRAKTPSRAKRCWPISRPTSRRGISGGIEPSLVRSFRLPPWPRFLCSARHERLVSALRARPAGAAPAPLQAGAVPDDRART